MVPVIIMSYDVHVYYYHIYHFNHPKIMVRLNAGYLEKSLLFLVIDLLNQIDRLIIINPLNRHFAINGVTTSDF